MVQVEEQWSSTMVKWCRWRSSTGSSGAGGGAVRSGAEHFGGGKRAKVGLAAIPECEDSTLLAKQVRIVSVDVCGF